MPTPVELREELRSYALTLPAAHEAHPWGESVVKVGKKIFLFLGTESQQSPGFGVKLTESHEEALGLPGVVPSGYGLGKAGWVSVTLPAGDAADSELYREWVQESYRAVALKRLIAELDARDAGAS